LGGKYVPKNQGGLPLLAVCNKDVRNVTRTNFSAFALALDLTLRKGSRQPERGFLKLLERAPDASQYA
jgi:hypothetical protein